MHFGVKVKIEIFNKLSYISYYMKNRKIPVITKRISLAVITSGFLLCSIIAFVAYRAFNQQFRIQYDNNIRSISEAARETLNPDKFEHYLATKEKDDDYIRVQKILQDFVNKFDLNMIYVSFVEAPDYKNITYIYNPVKEGSRFKEFSLGYSENYVEPEYNLSAKRVFENGECIVRHTLKTRSGSHITAMIPVYDTKGKIIAVLGAQKSIQHFVNAGRMYMRIVVFVECFFGIAFFILFTMYFSKAFIKPLTLITKETDHFASYGGEPSDTLLSIKDHDEIGILAHSVHQMEYDVCKNIAELTNMTAEKERISTELSVAAKIQSDMLPKEYPPFPTRKDFDLFALMTPAKEVGGDLYDYLLLDEDHLMITVGDVSGKGVPAALFMGKCKVLLDFYAYLKLSPAEIFNRANNQLCKGNDSGLFVTCWLGIFTFSTGELHFVNAGHTHPILYHDNKFDYIKVKPNIFLGGIENFKYHEESIKLSKGDRIFIYTDGVTEATNQNRELFEEERLLSAIKETSEMNAPDTIKSIRNKIDEFAGEVEQFDDITMLQFEWKNN